jgi:hypothetical protein
MQQFIEIEKGKMKIEKMSNKDCNNNKSPRINGNNNKVS